MATNAELDIKIRRYLSHKRPFLKFFYKFILFIFYYPFTRLLYFHRRFMDKIIFENEDRLIYSRIEGYVII